MVLSKNHGVSPNHPLKTLGLEPLFSPSILVGLPPPLCLETSQPKPSICDLLHPRVGNLQNISSGESQNIRLSGFFVSEVGSSWVDSPENGGKPCFSGKFLVLGNDYHYHFFRC